MLLTHSLRIDEDLSIGPLARRNWALIDDASPTPAGALQNAPARHGAAPGATLSRGFPSKEGSRSSPCEPPIFRLARMSFTSRSLGRNPGLLSMSDAANTSRLLPPAWYSEHCHDIGAPITDNHERRAVRSGADVGFEKSRPLILGAKWDILIDNSLAEMEIRNNGRFAYYLTNGNVGLCNKKR